MGRWRAVVVALIVATVPLTAASAVRARVLHSGGRPVASAVSSAAAPSRWVMGYYTVYDRAAMPIGQIDWSAMTHIVIGAAVPNADGTINTAFDGDRNQLHPFVTKLVAAAKAHGVVPLLMVGGAGEHHGFAAAATNHRSAFVTNLLATMHRFGFAGLDLDWEPVNQSDQAPLLALATALRQQAPSAVLTMPVGWVSKTFASVPSFYGTLARQLDRVDIMSYGMAGAWSGWKTWHSSALRGATASTPTDVALNVSAYRKAGVPAAKLGVGIGFYGTCWAGGVTRPRESIGSSYVAADDNTMTYTRIMSSYFNKSAYHYDRKAQAPYLSFSQPRGAQKCTFVSYENKRSVAAKGAYAEMRGLGSEIIWTINEGHVLGRKGANGDPLLAAVYQAFH